MQDFAQIKTRIAQMCASALTMWQTAFRAFMEHDSDLIAEALQEEQKLNDFEKEITTSLVEFNRQSPAQHDRAAALYYRDVVGDLELIGDYCKDVLERIEIKIQEKLLFSDESVEEYTQLYRISERALQEVAEALRKDDLKLIKSVLKNEEHIDSLVDEYRARHNQRLLAGVCTPMSCNMFLNMLDFTAAIYYHTKKIARNLLKVRGL